MKRSALIIFLTIACLNSLAQSTTNQKDGELFNHYIGAQIGQLIMHLFNSNVNSIGNGNPYLFTYSMNNKKTGWGFRAGIGCNFVDNSTANTNGTVVTNNNDAQLRAGVEKTFKLSNKWEAGTGFDLILNYNNDYTSNSYQNYYDTGTTTTKTLTTTYGGGVFGKVNYHLSNKILLGTEGSFYYVTGTSNQTVDNFSSNNGTPLTSETKSKPGFSKGNISLPIVIYLLLKF
jgi:hypothetical protein